MRDDPHTYIMFSVINKVYTLASKSGRIHLDYLDDILPINNIDYIFFCKCYVKKYEMGVFEFTSIQDIVNYIYDEHEKNGKHI